MIKKEKLEIGDRAPDFTLKDSSENTVMLKDFKGKWIVLYFYPKDNTPGCTIEAIAFTKYKKEFNNLELLNEAHVLAPRPIRRIKNIVVMDYIGTKTEPAPLLKDARLDHPDIIYKRLITAIDRMYTKVDIVHADLSEYNILMHKKKPYIIDLGQGVLKEHPYADEFLRRDIHNIVHFFKKYDIFDDEETVYNRVTQVRE